MNLNQVTVARDWLHACGQRHYTEDTAFPVVRAYTLRGIEFWDVIVPWQSTPWTVSEWRLAR